MAVDCKDSLTLFPLLAKGISFFYKKEVLLNDVNLTFNDNNLVAVMGPNGAGKSLLLKILHGLMKPSHGKISCGGSEMTLRHRLMQGMVSQKSTLMRRSVAENLDFVMRLRRTFDLGVRNELLDNVALLGKQKQHTMSLSGGERQRLALAVVLATKPKLLFVDEVTAHMDPTSTRLIESLLISQKEKGTKIICVTHDIGQAKRLAGKIIFMHVGRVIEETDSKEFFYRASTKEARDYLAGKLLL